MADTLVSLVGDSSPGGGDGREPGSPYIEINSTDAVTVLLELEFHPWQGGVNWMRDNRECIAWLTAVAIEQHLGYP